VRGTAGEFLAQTGYTVLEAKDGEEALAVAHRHQGEIHLLITDVVMPNMGGAKVAEQLTAARPNMRVLFVSGYAESTVVQQKAIDVAKNFLQKPFGLKTLARKVREVLEDGWRSAPPRPFPDNPQGWGPPV
jgi:two-component system, cell cycle sensor histidine kinase and response regulator CckA